MPFDTEQSSQLTKNIIRNTNIADLKKLYNLEYILPVRFCSSTDISKKRSDAAVFIHLFYEDLIEDCIPYIREASQICDIYITTAKTEIKHYLEGKCKTFGIDNCYIKLVENRGYDIASLVVHHRDDILRYKFFCFTHDKKSRHLRNTETGRLWFDNLWENTICSACFISNVLNTFDRNNLLGILCVPLPLGDDFLFCPDGMWYGSYQDTLDLANNFGVKALISPDKPCISVGTAFWARTDAVRLLFEKKLSLNDFPMQGVSRKSYAIERIFPYVAQYNGFYTATVSSDIFESYRINYIYSEAVDLVSFIRNITPIQTCDNFLRWKKNISVYENARKANKRIYLYGAGKIAKRIVNVLKFRTQSGNVLFDAVIVSDGQKQFSDFLGFKVFELSEVPDIKNSFFFIAMGEENAKLVKESLNAKGGDCHIVCC